MHSTTGVVGNGMGGCDFARVHRGPAGRKFAAVDSASRWSGNDGVRLGVRLVSSLPRSGSRWCDIGNPIVFGSESGHLCFSFAETRESVAQDRSRLIIVPRDRMPYHEMPKGSVLCFNFFLLRAIGTTKARHGTAVRQS